MVRRSLSNFVVRLRLFGILLVFVLLSGVQEGYAQDLVPDVTASTCTKPNGSITITANYGIGPYEYYLNGLLQIVLASNTFTFSGLTGGGLPYHIGVVDEGGGGYEEIFQPLGDLAGPTLNVGTITPATCLNNDGGLVLSRTGGNGPFTYSIDGGVNYVQFGTFTGLPNGPLTATVQDVNMCVSPPVAVPIPLNNDLVAATNDPDPICEGTSVTLLAGSNGQQFSWSPATGLDDPTKLTPVATPSSTTTYTLTATLGICTTSADELVTINPAPIADAGEDIQTCYGKTVVLRGSGGKFYHWTPSAGLTNPNVPFPIVLKPVSTVTYVLSVTDANGCTSLKSDSVTVMVTPQIQVAATPDTVVFVGQPVQLSVVGPEDPGGSSYLWSPSTGLDNPLIANPVALLTSPQTVEYIAQVTTSVGCVGADTITVKAFAVADIFVPNAFSPNNDGHNDVLRPIMPGIKTLKYFAVFDRWGRQVFSTTNAGVGWDGTLKGQALETGVYVWMVMGVDVSGRVVQRKGTVVLVK